MKDKKPISIICVLLCFMCGCAASLKGIMPGTENKAKSAIHETMTYSPETNMISEGSIWSEAEGFTLFTDRRARKVGDIVIVRIVENPEAQLNANTDTSRSSGVDASKLEFLGYMKALAEKNPRLAQNPGQDDLISSTLGMQFNGAGSSDRDGYVSAYVSAVVIKAFPNGNLLISGKREIKVNNETQYISISGVVRGEDIGPYNEIASTYVADANITYSGHGPLADKQRPGWLWRIVDYAWPF